MVPKKGPKAQKHAVAVWGPACVRTRGGGTSQCLNKKKLAAGQYTTTAVHYGVILVGTNLHDHNSRRNCQDPINHTSGTRP